MVLDIWQGGGNKQDQQRGVSNIPNVLKNTNVLIPTGYGTAATNQSETSKFLGPAGTGYEVIHTVSTGKTWYITGVVISGSDTGGSQTIATGASASEVDIFGVKLDSTNFPSFSMALTTPMKLTSATRVTVKDTTGTGIFTLIGWEE